MEIFKEKSQLTIKLDKLNAELDSYKLRLIENEIKGKRETLERLEIANARRIKTKFKRLKFIGQPKTYSEIIALLNVLDTYPLKSKERLATLEELCIFCNGGQENILKVRFSQGIKHAAKSLTSTDPSIILRALSLSGILT